MTYGQKECIKRAVKCYNENPDRFWKAIEQVKESVAYNAAMQEHLRSSVEKELALRKKSET